MKTPVTPRINSTAVHVDALESINNLSKNFERAASSLRVGQMSNLTVRSTPSAPASRIDKLQMKLKALKESADFYKAKGPEYKAQLQRVMGKYKKNHEKLMVELSLGDSDSD